MQGVQNLNMNTQYEVSLREPTRWSACVISSKGGGGGEGRFYLTFI